MALSDSDAQFLESARSVAMITVGAGGVPKVARVGAALVDGKVWSSGTADRVRTKHLRRDPRCTLYALNDGMGYLALEGTVTIIEGPDVPALSVKMFRIMQKKPSGPLSWFGGELSEEDFRQRMVEEKRLIYELEVTRTYGMA